jgi:hypothetical protein
VRVLSENGSFCDPLTRFVSRDHIVVNLPSRGRNGRRLSHERCTTSR